MNFHLSTAIACLWALIPALAIAETDGDWPTPIAEPWPAADALFHRDLRWRGGDGASSVDLGGGRVLWLFADSFVSNTAVSQRRGTRMVNNSLGIQQGYDPVTATFKCYWNSENDQPQSYFRPPDETWYWPASGAMIDKRLLIFLMHMRRSDQGMGFAFVDSAGVLVENPADSPDHWRTTPVDMPDDRFRIIYGSGGLSNEGETLFSLGSHAGFGHHAYLMRWNLAEVRRGDLSHPEWRVDDRWLPQAELDELPAPTLPLAQTEFTTHFDARLHAFLQVQCSYLAQSVGIRFARQRAGPWSGVPDIFTPEPIEQVFYYSGKAHPELAADGLAVTYCCNGRKLSQIIADESIYYPRFLRVQFAVKE